MSNTVADLPPVRPRFTMAEALILNALMNEQGQPVTVARLMKILQVLNSQFTPKPRSIGRHIYFIRAKLGEQAGKKNHKRIVSEWVEEDEHTLTTAYRFVE